MTGTTSPTEPQCTPEIDEVFRRIGRNLLLFQRIERLMKEILAESVVAGPVRSTAAALADRRARLFARSLGQLVEKLLAEVLGDSNDARVPDEVEEAWVSFRVSTQLEGEPLDHFVRDIRAVVDTRNELVHHFLLTWPLSSELGAMEALNHLEAQWVSGRAMQTRLEGMAAGQRQVRESLSQAMRSPQTQVALVWLLQDPLVVWLGEVAGRTRRANGWMDLATAGNFLRRERPEEFAGLAQRRDHRTLKSLLKANTLFDVEEEKTSSGGTRTIYRVKPLYAMEIRQDGAA